MSQQNTPQSPQETQPEPRITTEQITHTEAIISMSFTDKEREQMRRALSNRADHLETLHSISIPNHVPPPLYFDPRLPQPIKTEADIPREYAVSDIPALERPENLEDVAFYPLTHLAELIRTRKVTSVELTQMYLERLKRYDPYLKCVVSYTETLAMEQAKRADDEIAAGIYRSPLHGIPWGAKDLLATRNYKTTWGAEPWQDQVLDLDATVVKRLEAAGAVLIAKLTLGALAYGDIWFGGTTKNPWDITEGSSGSSAGSASAVAAGLVGFAIGTETLGSIVSPSTRCGVTGLRPTFGRVSRHGAMALCWSMDKIGTICREVEDCALVFTAIYGPDGMDKTVVDTSFYWNPDLKVTDLRIGYVPSAFEEEYPNKANDNAVLDVLRGLGVNLIPVKLPDIPVEPLLLTLFAESAAAFDEMTRTNQDDLLTWQEDNAWPNGFRASRFIPAVEYIQANRLRMQLMVEMAASLKEVDVFVVPSFGGNALYYTNFTGHPTVVLPNGFTEKGTKASITFIGGLYQDAETLTVAKAYQDATDFHLKHPEMKYDSL